MKFLHRRAAMLQLAVLLPHALCCSRLACAFLEDQPAE